MAWATVDEVETITGKTVTADQLAQAQSLIELVIDRDETAVGTSAAVGTAGDYEGRSGDLRRLKLAVAYQAAHLATTGVDVHAVVGGLSALSQPDLSLSFREGGDAVERVLSPLALRACRQLTWRRDRSVRIGSALTASRARIDEHGERDYGIPWTPLPNPGG